MKSKHFLSIKDASAEELLGLVETASRLKKHPVDTSSPLLNRSMAMIFDKSSLRTRVSFEVGMTQLGGHALYLAPDDIKLGVRESVRDTAKVISSMADIMIARVSRHDDVVELAKHSSVPVINAMTDREHPCQIMADLLTMYDHFGRLDGLEIAYVGDANNNVTTSLAMACETLGLGMRIAAPEGYEMPEDIRELVPSVQHFTQPKDGVMGADVVVTDTWVSMGKEAESRARLAALRPYQVDAKLMHLASERSVFMHCLPAYRGNEVTAEVIDGPRSLVFSEAENRLHAQKAIVLELLSEIAR